MTAPLSAVLARLLSDPLAVAVALSGRVPVSMVEEAMGRGVGAEARTCLTCREPFTPREPDQTTCNRSCGGARSKGGKRLKPWLQEREVRVPLASMVDAVTKDNLDADALGERFGITTQAASRARARILRGAR